MWIELQKHNGMGGSARPQATDIFGDSQCASRKPGIRDLDAARARRLAERQNAQRLIARGQYVAIRQRQHSRDSVTESLVGCLQRVREFERLVVHDRRALAAGATSSQLAAPVHRCDRAGARNGLTGALAV